MLQASEIAQSLTPNKAGELTSEGKVEFTRGSKKYIRKTRIPWTFQGFSHSPSLRTCTQKSGVSQSFLPLLFFRFRPVLIFGATIKGGSGKWGDLLRAAFFAIVTEREVEKENLNFCTIHDCARTEHREEPDKDVHSTFCPFARRMHFFLSLFFLCKID